MRAAFWTVALTHTVAIVALHWPTWQVALLALVCWGLAVLGAGEPRPTRSARHRDVQEAERTALGRALMYRELWMIERPYVCVPLIALVSALVAAGAIALGRVPREPLAIARVIAWTPATLLAGGFILGATINAWAVTFPLVALWLLLVGMAAAEGDGLLVLRLLAGGTLPIAALFCADMLRGTRRALERAQRAAAESSRGEGESG